MKRNKRRYKIIERDWNCVTVVFYDHIFDNQETRTYTSINGAVYDTTEYPGTMGNQICEELHYVGNTLFTSEEEKLIHCIRRELRKRMRKG